MSFAVILGTSRELGNTHQLANSILNMTDARLFNLNDYSFTPYDYKGRNLDDDYEKLITELMQYDHWMFATPIYWYSMSAQMKLFFDRISDLLSFKKEFGRKLKGKDCSLLATGNMPESPDCFEEPFRLSAKYLGMNYNRMIYCYCDHEDGYVDEHHEAEIKSFVNQIQLA